MAQKTWTLVDVASGTYLDERELDANELGFTGARVRKRTLRGGLRDGIEVIDVDASVLTFMVLPTRGMGIWKAWLDADDDDFELGWQSPVRGPVHPSLVPVNEPSGLGWLEGFDELLCRCGLLSNGPPVFDDQGRLVHNLHGRIANLPAHKVEVIADSDTGEITIRGEVDESRFLFHSLRLTTTITAKVGESRVRITDRITNLSAKDAEFELLYHINVGGPLLEESAKLVAPVKTLVPRNARAVEGLAEWDTYGPPQAGFAEQVYFFELAASGDGGTAALLRNRAGDRGLSVEFNKQQLPCFILWKNTGSIEDGYVTGLEPAVNFPNPRPFEKEQGRVRQLGPGASFECELTLTVHSGRPSVQEAERAIAAMQSTVEPQIFDNPQKGWTSDAK